MSTNLASEVLGFKRFLIRAGNLLIKWYGPHCGDEAAKIVFMASKEWDGMADMERKPFIKQESSTNTFFKYLLQKHNNSYSTNTIQSQNNLKTLHPEQFQVHAIDWHSMSSEDKNKFSSMGESELGMNHVITQRDKLHQVYAPRDLIILEFILKTKPKLPQCPRVWFFRTQNDNLRPVGEIKKWDHLTIEEKSIYERCAMLDKKRFFLENNAWITKLVMTDLQNDDFTLSDFELKEIRSKIESIGSLIDLSKELPPFISLKQPRKAFSLFIEAYRKKIREKRPQFKFGDHLKSCSEAWRKLSEEEKQFYRNESKKLREERMKLYECAPGVKISRLVSPADLFRLSKTTFGPCRISHLYGSTPSVMRLWAESNNVKDRPLKPLWNALEASEKDKYQAEYRKLREVVELNKKSIDAKHKYVKDLVKKATELSLYKQEIGLIYRGTKNLRNMYTSRPTDMKIFI